MSDLALYQGGYGSGLSRRESGRAAREIARGSASVAMRESRIENETDVTIAKGDSLTAVGAHAMTDVTRITKLQEQLEQQCPAASGRVNALADSLAYGMADLFMDHERRLRRY